MFYLQSKQGLKVNHLQFYHNSSLYHLSNLGGNDMITVNLEKYYHLVGLYHLVSLRGVVKKAVGLGGWHWLVLTNGDEVKLQRNALSVIEVPREEEIYDCGDVSFSGSDLGSRNTPRRALDDMSFHPSKEQLVEAVERHFLSQDSAPSLMFLKIQLIHFGSSGPPARLLRHCRICYRF
ncbi:uncharacterized protein LOC143862716 isoform X2 [Tasmannia lanceolata]|uniref:uncharacterized protein LOC143862716 isoform X2 n=1 Tax=Tasmannia lanceolata TaxID=3420 RepID=UPI0040642E43